MALSPILQDQATDTETAGDAIAAGLWERRWSGLLASGARVVLLLDDKVVDSPVNVDPRSERVVFQVGAGTLKARLEGADAALARHPKNKTSVTVHIVPAA